MKETMRDRIKSIANDPHIKERYDMYADMVLGDLREALLSDAAVEAARFAYMNTDVRDFGYYSDTATWDDAGYEATAIGNALTAALVAMGAVTEEEQGDE